MKITIFGLTISSSWGNGHATLWRALCRSLVKRGHAVTFFEQDVPYYRQHRDLTAIKGVKLILYPDWEPVRETARAELADADVGMVTSYCADGIAAGRMVLDSPARVKTFYDLDTSVTLDRLARGEKVDYLLPEGLGDFNLVLSYTGGESLRLLESKLQARRAVPLYGSVDPEIHTPVSPSPGYRADLSYLGTFAADRQDKLERLFLQPAAQMPHAQFTLAGSCYPADFAHTPNIRHFEHLPPAEHARFFCSSRFTLNITREAMARFGYCPSPRLFEAAACGVPLLSDCWEGMGLFFEPDHEIRCVDTCEEVVEALRLPDEELARQARAARERTLDCHTSDHRARELENILNEVLHV